MWELDYKESWVLKNWCFWIVVLEKTLESPLACKEIQQVHPKGDQSWVFIGRTDVEAETPILGLPDVKNWLIWKEPDAGKEWGQDEKGTTEDEMVGWHHQLNGHGFGWTPGVGDGLGGLAHCGTWGRKDSDMTERLNWTELKSTITSEALHDQTPTYFVYLYIILDFTFLLHMTTHHFPNKTTFLVTIGILAYTISLRHHYFTLFFSRFFMALGFKLTSRCSTHWKSPL